MTNKNLQKNKILKIIQKTESAYLSILKLKSSFVFYYNIFRLLNKTVAINQFNFLKNYSKKLTTWGVLDYIFMPVD